MIYMFNVTHYCLQMFLKTLEMNLLKKYELDPAHFVSAPELAMASMLKKY